MFSCYRIGGILIVVTFLILEGDTKRHNMREESRPPPRDYRPTKWVANSAMDVWYGNKSMIDVISREFADIMYKLTARPVRSVLRYRTEKGNNASNKQQIPSKRVSRVEINFFNSDNNTFHTIKLQPMKQVVNKTVFKVLEPLLEIDY